MGTSDLDALILDLYDIQAVKFGSFTLKSGIQSPVYFDLRVIVSFPKIMSRVSQEMWKTVTDAHCKFDNICGVPYTALPIATCISTSSNTPMLIRRKEAKDYGTKKMIEGSYKDGDVCLIIEDVVTSGSSVYETVQTLKKEGIVVRDAVVLLNREQGGKEMLDSQNITLHSVCTVTKLLEVLHNATKIDTDTVKSVEDFIAANKTFPPPTTTSGNGDKAGSNDKNVRSYEERAALCSHPVAKRIFTIMAEKQTNLVVSADVTSAEQLLRLVDQVGPHVCAIKTHVDIIQDFTSYLLHRLTDLAHAHNFIIFEDRKFADIGNTVKHQYQGGIYKISQWAHLINAHALPGPGVIEGLKQVGIENGRACLLIAEMSSKGNLLNEGYTKDVVAMAENHKDFVIGFISQTRVSPDPSFIHMTPGVQLEAGGDALGQQYNSPATVIQDKGSDVIIVGRGIVQDADPARAARRYKDAGYAAYISMMTGQ